MLLTYIVLCLPLYLAVFSKTSMRILIKNEVEYPVNVSLKSTVFIYIYVSPHSQMSKFFVIIYKGPTLKVLILEME